MRAVQEARAAGRAVVIVTSREFIWRDQAIDWLRRHDIDYQGLYLRIVGDNRKDTVVKNEIFDHLVDVRRLDELRGVERRDGSLWIGAGTTQAAIERERRAVAQLVPLL